MSESAQDVSTHVEVSSESKRQVRAMPLVEVSQTRRDELKRFLRETLPSLRKVREERVTKVETKWAKTLSGLRSRPAPKRGVSNLSTPLTIWAASGARARLYEGSFGSLPLVGILPHPGSAVLGQEDAKNLGKFLQAEILNPRGLNGRAAGEKIIAELVNYGTGVLKVCREPDNVFLVNLGRGPQEKVVRGRPKWEYVAFADFLYWNGYGPDVQHMPYAGHEFDRTWSELSKWAELGYYDEEAVTRVEQFYGDLQGVQGSGIPASARPHKVAEIYVDFPIDDSNIPAALVLDWHCEAEEFLRIAWSQSGEVRPLFVGQFDYNPDPTRLEGQGICEKLEGVQDETDAVHNIAIEAGKRAAAHLIGVRHTSQAERDLGGGADIIPGDVYSSEDPDADVAIKQLGDPNAALAALQLEEHSRLYVMRILGFDDSNMGNMASAKRVASAVGQTINRESRVVMMRALNSLGQVLTDACYLTLDIYKQDLPLASLVAAVGREAAERLSMTVFSVQDVSSRDQMVLTVNSRDASLLQETRKQELMVLTQFLFGFYDKLIQYGTMVMQVPPPMQPMVLSVLSKLENATRLLLANVETIDNADEVLPQLAQQMEEFTRMSQSVAGQGPQVMGPSPAAAPGAQYQPPNTGV